jgi:hypothetical protein
MIKIRESDCVTNPVRKVLEELDSDGWTIVSVIHLGGGDYQVFAQKILAEYEKK